MAELLFRRLIQAATVMLAMSMLVFAGVYAIGNPIDVLIGPDASQAVRAEVIAATASISRSGGSISASSTGSSTGISGAPSSTGSRSWSSSWSGFRRRWN